MPKNEAAWLVARNDRLQVREAPYPEPGAGEVVVRNHAVAVNPVDWIVPYLAGLPMFPWIKRPFILGSDLAGEVVAVGGGVTEVKVGDRVLAMAAGACKQRNRAAEGAFQAYTIVLPRLTTVIPDHLSYAEAAVVPLGVTTAACGLFQSDLLALELPTAKPKARDQWVIIWGGATSVGGNAIQLAVAAGYEVVATASPKNFAYVKALGATTVFDYRSATVVADIRRALETRTLAGALAIGVGSASACVAVVSACEGNRFVAMATPAVSFERAPTGAARTFWLIPPFARMIATTATTTIRARLTKVGVKFIWGGALVDNEVSQIIYSDFLPRALSDGRYTPAPPPQVVGCGLDAIPGALKIQRSGVSARKIVVAL